MIGWQFDAETIVGNSTSTETRGTRPFPTNPWVSTPTACEGGVCHAFAAARYFDWADPITQVVATAIVSITGNMTVTKIVTNAANATETEKGGLTVDGTTTTVVSY